MEIKTNVVITYKDDNGKEIKNGDMVRIVFSGEKKPDAIGLFCGMTGRGMIEIESLDHKCTNISPNSIDAMYIFEVATPGKLS